METAASSAPGDRRAMILIVEDSPVQAELLRRDLDEAGYRVIVAGDGAEGLAMAKANHPAAVVSDINMPVMDGYAMCQAIRREDSLKTTPVILLTMLSDAEDVIRGLEVGADAYVTKPYNILSLVARLTSLLAFPPPAPPGVERRKVEMRLHGVTHLVDAHGPRMLNLLISTYENAVLQNRELAVTQQALEDLNGQLEQKVEEKTAVIAASATRYRRLFEAARDGILLLDAQSGQIVDVNPFMIELLGYTREQYLGKKLWEIGPFKDTAAAKAAFEELQKKKYVHYEGLPLSTADGRDIDVEFVSHVYLVNGGEVIQCNIRDITERKRAEAATAASEMMYRRLFEAARDGILILDAQSGQIVDVNLFMIELLGYTREQYLGKKLWEIGPFKDTAAAIAAFEELQKKKYVHYEGLPLSTADGRDIDVEFVSHVYLVNGGEVIQCNIRDITERKRAEQEFRRLNWALRALSLSNSALVHTGTEQELFQACCDAIAVTEVYPLAWIGRTIDDPAHSIEVAAAAGKAVKYMQDFEVSWGDTPKGSGPTGTAIRTSATQVANNLAESAAYLPWIEGARAHGLASSIALPIRANGSVMGVLTIYSSEVNAFNRSEVDLFEELVADIGYGITSRRTLTQRDHLQQEQLLDVKRLKDALIGTIGAVALTVEKRDPYTAGHQLRVMALCAAIGQELNFSEDRLEGLRLGATIHDIGKIYVPAEILNRPGKLTAPELEIIKSHPQVGYDIVKDVKFPWPVKEMILQHHERLDGSGYPQGLKGDEIILEARILAVADVVEAMSSHRPYRAGLGLDAALAQVRQEAGTRLDAQVVDACERVFREEGFAFEKT